MKNKKKNVLIFAILLCITVLGIFRIKELLVENSLIEKYTEAVAYTYNAYKNYIDSESEDNYESFTIAFSKLPELANNMSKKTVQNKHFNELNTMYSLLIAEPEKARTMTDLIYDIVNELYIDIDDPNPYENMFVFRNRMSVNE